MMEWEPSTLNNENNPPGHTENNGASIPTEETSSRNLAGADPNNYELRGQFEKHDILLNGGRFKCLFKEGSSFYREQLVLACPHLLHNSACTRAAAQLVMDAVWVIEGRFLLLEPKTGTISVAPNATAVQLIQRDLRKLLNAGAATETIDERSFKTKSKTKKSSGGKRKSKGGDGSADKQAKPKSAGKPTLKKHSKRRNSRYNRDKAKAIK